MRKSPWLALACAGGVLAALAAGATAVLAAPSGWLNVDGSIRFLGGGGTYDWANAGPSGAACANGGVNVTGSGGVFNCGRPAAAGAPPIAPALTAAAASDPSIISAVFLVDPISTDNTACGAGDPTTLSGTNGSAIGSYAISVGPVPAKDDLSNVYAVSHTRADNGHPELYFAAERLVNNGDSHIDFEFLQSVVGRTAACGGSFTGHRTQGDLLVAVDFTNGGALASTTVYQWHCTPLPNPQPADGTVCDPGAGALYESIGAPPALSATVNAADVPCGGWICRDNTGVTGTVLTNDFLEGGIDLQGLAFTGCLNTFLPHTRTSAPFNAQLKDFAGPVALRSCRNPATSSNSAPSGSVSPGASVTDTVDVASGGAGFTPTGSVAFYLCQPAQVSGSGCSTGTQVGAAKPLVAGAATSDPTSATSTGGKYCWRTVYTPDAGSTGVYTPATHTNSTTECFNVAIAAFLPNTGIPDVVRAPGWIPLSGLAMLPGLVVALAWRRTRSIAALLLAAIVAGASPSMPQAPPAAAGQSQQVLAIGASTTPPGLVLSTVTPRGGGWRLVIRRIGVDAQILPVGLDRNGAMAAPARLDAVGWFDRGPAPGQAGDAVIDGHYGVSEPAVFRRLHLLRPGDEIEVVWPAGRTVSFEVSGTATVAADAHPAGVFSGSGSARLTLVTCSGAWVPGLATYSDRLIVTATVSS